MNATALDHDDDRWYWGYDSDGLNRIAASVLHDEGFRHVGRLLTAELYARPHGDVWAVSDNGGEVNVVRVNDSGSLVSVAVPDAMKPLTLGYRITAVLKGQRIDYTFDMDAE